MSRKELVICRSIILIEFGLYFLQVIYFMRAKDFFIVNSTIIFISGGIFSYHFYKANFLISKQVLHYLKDSIFLVNRIIYLSSILIAIIIFNFLLIVRNEVYFVQLYLLSAFISSHYINKLFITRGLVRVKKDIIPILHELEFQN